MQDYVNEFLKNTNDKIIEMVKNITENDLIKAKEEILNNPNVDEKIKSQMSQFTLEDFQKNLTNPDNIKQMTLNNTQEYHSNAEIEGGTRLVIALSILGVVCLISSVWGYCERRETQRLEGELLNAIRILDRQMQNFNLNNQNSVLSSTLNDTNLDHGNQYISSNLNLSNISFLNVNNNECDIICEQNNQNPQQPNESNRNILNSEADLLPQRHNDPNNINIELQPINQVNQNQQPNNQNPGVNLENANHNRTCNIL
jgi:hypothetical protein